MKIDGVFSPERLRKAMAWLRFLPKFQNLETKNNRIHESVGWRFVMPAQASGMVFENCTFFDRHGNQIPRLLSDAEIEKQGAELA